METETKDLNLPLFFKPLFWSYKFSSIDSQKDKKQLFSIPLVMEKEALDLEN